MIQLLVNSWPARDTNGRWEIMVLPSEIGGESFLVIGDNGARASDFETMNFQNSRVLANLSSILSPLGQLGDGTFLATGAVVNADAREGRSVILNTGYSVDHDCVLGEIVHVSYGALCRKC